MPRRITDLEIPYGWEDDRIVRTFEDVKSIFNDVDEELGMFRIGLRFAPGTPALSEAAVFVCDDNKLELTGSWWTSDVAAGGGADPNQIFKLRRRDKDGGDATLIGTFETNGDALVAFRRRELPANKESRAIDTGQSLTFEVEDDSPEGTPANVTGLLELYFRRLDN